jgi:predicted CXXCH cytochrome family protein
LIAVSVVAVAALTLVATSGRASADGGPHGGYGSSGGIGPGGPGTALPDQCAACHRVHQGQSVGKLLKATSPYSLCLTCHNGTGSRLDVWDGVKLSAFSTDTAGTVRIAETATLTVSAAPVADVRVPLGDSVTVYTVAIRNRSSDSGGEAVTIARADSGDPTLVSSVGALYVAGGGVPPDGAGTVPAAVSSVPGVAYFDVTVTGTTALDADTVLSTVTVTLTDIPAETPAVALRTTAATALADSETLNGGGFMFVNGDVVTSRHNADPADNSLQPWGMGANNTGQQGGGGSNQLSNPLQCTSCHNPHGTSNYRLLKAKINNNDVVVRAFVGGSFVKDEGARGLESGASPNKYTVDYYGSSGGGGAPANTSDASVGNSLSSLCGACHTAYPSIGASDPLSTGGATHYRHKTEMPYTDWINPETTSPVSNNPETSPLSGFPNLRLASNSTDTDKIVTCLTCHRVHGTATTMSGYALINSIDSSGLGDDDLTPSQTTDSTSTLLFTDNRGMCQACHQWGQ